MHPTRKERTALNRNLKQYAFDESPLFKDGIIQAMETTQSFELISHVPEECWLPGTLTFDQVRIKLGFLATRFSEGAGSRPVYTYEVSVVGTHLIHPRQLDLSDDAWDALTKKYLEDEEFEQITMFHETDTQSPDGVTEEMKDEIIDCLIDDDAECELYQKSVLSYATCDDSIESNYERGVSIANGLYDSVSTHDHYDNDWKMYATPDGDLYVPESFAPDELLIGDEIEVRLQFTDLIRACGIDQEAAESGLIPYDDKVREMLYIVDCMRKRRIEL